ncbi:MAG: flagellar basal body P-ring protein FlgI [Pirellulales bacterium]|nr:flagellar basal body P-ring protein FlgI [Pirellulales bacterium]
MEYGAEKMNRAVGYSTFALCFLFSGCMGPILRPQSPEAQLSDKDSPKALMVGDVAHPYGLGYVKLEAVALVTGLAGTGEDPPPSPQRAALLAEMNRREVENPNQILASPNTSLVLVRGFLRPGIQAGDHFDVEVRTSSRSNTTSLRDGQLLEARMTEMAVLGNQLRQGHLMAYAEGPVLVDPTASSKNDPALARQGRILGGGRVTKSRSLGLVLDHQRQSIRMSQTVGKAINKRFYSYFEGQRKGVATPKTDEFLELQLHPRYKDNVGRYMRIVRSIPLSESHSQLQARLQILENQLLDPITSAQAALRLEAIGNEQAIEVLKHGLEGEDPEVRFYAAEALAYLDVTEAVDQLAKIACDEPAFRAHALVALSAMDDGAAYDHLRSLLEVKSAETRYGAFRSLWAMAPNDPLIRGDVMNGKFSYHILDVPGEALVHVTNSHRPEIVLFGKDHLLKLPLVLDAGTQILVNGLSGGEVKISRFGETTQQRVVSNNLDAVIRTVVELGGEYPDVVQMLQQAKDTGALSSRFRVNALPSGGGELLESNKEAFTEEESTEAYHLQTPEPELFGRKS